MHGQTTEIEITPARPASPARSETSTCSSFSHTDSVTLHKEAIARREVATAPATSCCGCFSWFTSKDKPRSTSNSEPLLYIK